MIIDLGWKTKHELIREIDRLYQASHRPPLKSNRTHLTTVVIIQISGPMRSCVILRAPSSTVPIALFTIANLRTRGTTGDELWRLTSGAYDRFGQMLHKQIGSRSGEFRVAMNDRYGLVDVTNLRHDLLLDPACTRRCEGGGAGRWMQ